MYPIFPLGNLRRFYNSDSKAKTSYLQLCSYGLMCVLKIESDKANKDKVIGVIWFSFFFNILHTDKKKKTQ